MPFRHIARQPLQPTKGAIFKGINKTVCYSDLEIFSQLLSKYTTGTGARGWQAVGSRTVRHASRVKPGMTACR